MSYRAEKQSSMLEVPVHTESLPLGRFAAAEKKGHFMVEEELTQSLMALVDLPMYHGTNWLFLSAL